MELVFTKKLLQEIISKEIEEQGTDPAAAQPESGTSDTQAGGQGYPQVGKWESGVGREGPANQIGVTKWSDVVGAKLTRGKANPLKEQEIGMQPGRATQIAQSQQGLIDTENQRKIKEKQDFHSAFIPLKTPHSTQIKEGAHLILPKSVNGKETTFSKYTHPINPQEIFKSWVGSQWESYIPTQEQIEDILPDNTLRSFTVNGVYYSAHLKRIDDDPITWQFLWYYDKDMKPYNQNLYIKTEEIPDQYKNSFLKEWGEDIMMAASVLSAIFIPGLGGIALGVLLDLGVAGIKLQKGDTWGAGICTILAFLPVVGEIANVGRVSTKTAERLVKEVGADVNSYKELVNKINSMSNKSDAYLLRQLLMDDPHRIINLIDKFLSKNLLNKITTRAEALIVVKHLNGLLKTGKITKVAAAKWYQRLGLKKLGFYLGGSLGIMLGGGVAELAYEIYINSMVNSQYGLTPEENELIELADKAYKSNPELYKQKIDPVIKSYINIYGKSNSELLYKLMNGLHGEFIKNQNFDPIKFGNEIELQN